jgi:hypothetical protein
VINSYGVDTQNITGPAARKRSRKGIRHRRVAGACSYPSCSKRPEPGRHACKSHLRSYARCAAELRARRNAAGLCVCCGKREQFWGTRCIICRERYSRRPVPVSALRAIRHYRETEAKREAKQIKEKVRAAALELLAQRQVFGKRGLALALYVGIDGGEWRTYRQIARIMNLSCERIRQLLVPSKIALEAKLDVQVPWRTFTQ